MLLLTALSDAWTDAADTLASVLPCCGSVVDGRVERAAAAALSEVDLALV